MPESAAAPFARWSSSVAAGVRELRAMRHLPAGRAVGLLAWIAIGLGGFGVVYANWDMLAGNGRPSLQGAGDTGNYLWLRSAVLDGDFDFADDIAAAPTLDAAAREIWLAAPRSANGSVINEARPGWALVTLPAFLVGHALAWVTGATTDGWSAPYFVAVWLWHLALAGFGGWWAWRVVARFARADLAAAAVLAVWVASPLVYYMAGRVGLVHGLVFTLVAGLYHETLTARDQPEAAPWWRWVAIGKAAGLLLLVHVHALVYLLFPAIVVGAALARTTGATRRRIALGVGGPVAGALLLAAGANWVQHGSVFGGAAGHVFAEYFFLRAELFAVLLSPRHGLFYWHPLLLIGFVGLAYGIARRGVPHTWAVSTIVLTWINASWHAWWFGTSFGHRGFDGAVLFAMVGLGVWLQRASEADLPRWRGRVLAAAMGAAVLAGGVWLVLFVVQAIPREDAVTYGDLWRAVWGR